MTARKQSFGVPAKPRLLHSSAAGVAFLLVVFLVSCSHPTTDAPAGPADPATRLQRIPVPSPEKYRNTSSAKDWKNPYLIVREDGIGLLDLANSEIHILKPDEVPAALAALPPSAWPYGRVVLVTQVETKNATDQMKADLRKNRGLLVGTLMALEVQVFLP